MNCQDFQTRLDHTFAIRDGLDLELQQHGETCCQPACRRAWEDFLLLKEAIQDWRDLASLTPLAETPLTRAPGQPARTRSGSVSARLQPSFDRRSLSGAGFRAGRVKLLLSLSAAGFLLFMGWNLRHSTDTVTAPSHRQLSDHAALAGMGSSKFLPGAEVPLIRESGIPVLSLTDSAPAGLLVNWITGTPLQVSGSMALLLLNGTSGTADSSGWVPSWMEGWSEQLIPTMEDIEILRPLLQDQQDHQSQNLHEQARVQLA